MKTPPQVNTPYAEQDENFNFGVGAFVNEPDTIQVDPSMYEEPKITQPSSGTGEQPTVVSTDSMRAQLEQAQKDLDKYKAETATPTETVVPTDTTATEVTQPTDSGEETKSPELLAIELYSTNSQKEIDQRKKDFDRYQTRSDNLLKSQVKSIQKTFDVRRTQAEENAANAKAASLIVGSRTGRLRYAPEIQAGIITGQENAKIKLLSEIDALELQAIANAENAALNRDYDSFLDEIENIDNLKKERLNTIKELNAIMEEENQRRADEAEATKNEIAVMEQISLGTTDPVELFSLLNGKVPFDTIKEYTDALGYEDTNKPVVLGRYDRLIDPKTGKVIAGQALGGGGGFVGSTGATGGGQTITDADISNMNDAERDFVTKVMRQLPTKLKDSEKEAQDRKKEALYDFRKGRSVQDVVDEMNGYVVENQELQGLADVFRQLAIGSDLELSQVSASINTGNPEQAMTAVENAKLDNVQSFFSGVDKARSTVKQADNVLSILNDPTFPSDKLGAFDQFRFKFDRQTGWGKEKLTSEEELKVQQLESALQLLNAPIRVEIVGTAATEAEMSKITGFQATLGDQPSIVKSKVEDLRDSVLRFHNEARSQQGLPTVDKGELVDNKARLDLYKGMAKQVDETKYKNESNSSLLLGGDGVREDDIYGQIGL